MILHKQNTSIVIFFYHLFSPVRHSHSCLPPCHAGKLCRKGFVPGSDERPPTPTPPPALPVLRSRRDWESGFDPSLENWFLTWLLWDPPGRDPVSAPGWRASSSWNSVEAQLSKALLRWGLPCEGAGDMGIWGRLAPCSQAVSLCWEWDPGHPGKLCQAGSVLPVLAQPVPAAPGSADNPSSIQRWAKTIRCPRAPDPYPSWTLSLWQLRVHGASPTRSIPADTSPFVQAEVIDFFIFH